MSNVTAHTCPLAAALMSAYESFWGEGMERTQHHQSSAVHIGSHHRRVQDIGGNAQPVITVDVNIKW
jgi:hypothetical protein